MAGIGEHLLAVGVVKECLVPQLHILQHLFCLGTCRKDVVWSLGTAWEGGLYLWHLHKDDRAASAYNGTW